MLSSLLYIAHTLGISTSQLLAIGSLTAVVTSIKTYRGINDIISQNAQNQHNKMKNKQKTLEVNTYDEEMEKTKAEIEKQLEKIKIEKKQREINEYKLIETHADPVLYKGLKPKNRHDLLLGYNAEYQPVWGSDTNYIVAGCTGSGKTRLVYCILLNYLANKQGIAYVCDLKGVDFKYFKGCQGVSIYIDDIKDVMQAIVAFQAEYEHRQALFSAENYIDINDYNSRNPNAQLKDFLLIIDEFADISDTFSKNHKPIGIYQKLIEMARKCRAYGGRIILGTQRPSSDVIIGTLKANCTLIGLRTINSLNSKIIIDTEGCERLDRGEALTIINGDLVKIFSYFISDSDLKKFTSKLR